MSHQHATLDRRADGSPAIILSSAGRRVELLRLFQNALAHAAGRVVAIDSGSFAPASFLADVSCEVPPCTAPGFVEQVISVCAEHGVSMIVPTIDTELPVYAGSIGLFASAGVEVVVSSPETIAITGDKRLFHGFLVDNGIPTVRQANATQVDAVMDHVGLPCIVKPARGSSSVGLAIAETKAGLEAFLGRDQIAQSIAPGDEYTVDVFCSLEGQTLAAVPRRRIAVRGGEVAKGMTESFPAVAELAVAVVERLPGVRGPMCVQIFHDPADGALRVIEVNARFGGGFPLSAAAGADYTSYLIALLTGSALPSLEWRSGVTMTRYDQSVFVDQAGRIL